MINRVKIHFLYLLLIAGCASPTGITQFPGFDLPEGVYVNDDTLNFYHTRYISGAYNRDPVRTERSTSPRELIFEKRQEHNIESQLNKTALISYLMMENGIVKIDDKSPEERFGHTVKDDTYLIANSISKSIVSYLLGHAICRGYIEDVSSTLNDWEVINNTLYKDSIIMDVINMRTGDQNYISKKSNTLLATEFNSSSSNPFMRNVSDRSIKGIMTHELLNSKKSSLIFNYTSLPPMVIFNYIFHKVPNPRSFVNDVFQNYIKTEHPVSYRNNTYVPGEGLMRSEWGTLTGQFWMTRYDYLRFAKTILDDWKNDTCVGKYMKNLMKNKISKGSGEWKEDSTFGTPKSYGGFFHFDYDYPGLRGKNIIGMDGYGGQMILINLDENRIIVTNAIHLNYDYKRIVYQVAATGKP